MKNSHHETETKLTFLQTLGSVLAAFGGVQTMKTLRRDFHSNSAWKFIIVGLAVTAGFVTVIVLIARSVAS